MTDQWMIRGPQFTNCNCSYGCPCQFNAPSTHGQCEAVFGGIIEEGNFNQTRLDGLHYALIFQWPGEIPEGNGKQLTIIDERADPDQREALRKILHGESTRPGATHFFVFNSTTSHVYDTQYKKIDVEIDLEARMAKLSVPDMIQSHGTPIINPFSGSEHRVAIELADSFEYTRAEIGSGISKTHGPIALDLEHTYGQFCMLHMNQDGVIH